VKMPGHDVWVLRRGSRESMIPAVKEFVKAVDVERRMIVISVIEGLIDE
jgi:16S rRNA processing protein RimM